MCSVNDARRRDFDKRIFKLENERLIYANKQEKIDSCCGTLDCISKKVATLGEMCSHINIGGAIDHGKGAYYSSGFTSLSSDLEKEKAAYQKIIDAINKSIDRAKEEKANLPINCRECPECCPPVTSTALPTTTVSINRYTR